METISTFYTPLTHAHTARARTHIHTQHSPHRGNMTKTWRDRRDM